MRQYAILAALGFSLACAGRAGRTLSQAPAELEGAGVIVMAHGGNAEWNQEVASAVRALREKLPTALALGMADPVTLQAALDSLRDQRVARVAVVRLFISGASFRHQTEYLLGLRRDPPPYFVHHRGHDEDPPPALDHEMAVATHNSGLMDAPEVQTVVADRTSEVSTHPARESVLILAHGMGEPADNEALLHALEIAAHPVKEVGYRAVRIETLREDWPDERAAAEERIRSFVAEQTAEGTRVIVVPFRISGFGPYAKVLEGLDYKPARGFLPHPAVERWIERTAGRTFCANNWSNPLDSCKDGIPVVAPVRPGAFRPEANR